MARAPRGSAKSGSALSDNASRKSPRLTGRNKDRPAGRSVSSAATSPKKGRQNKNKKTSAKAKVDTLESSSGETSEATEGLDSTAVVQSGSSSGYNWDTEQLNIKPEDLTTRLRSHSKISTTLQREGIKQRHVTFEPTDMIWVCPDPASLPENTDGHPMNLQDLPTSKFWLAQVVDCYSLDQWEDGSGALGLLRVRWYFDPDEAMALPNLHNDYKKRLLKHKFESYEVIYSDHYDFIGLDTYAGHADGILAWLEIKGLEVEDAERVGPLANRSAKTKHGTIWMTGFGKKTYGKPGRSDAVAGYVKLWNEGNRREKKTNKDGTVARPHGDSDEEVSS